MKWVLLGMVTLSTSMALGFDDDSELLSYNEIVNDLEMQTKTTVKGKVKTEPTDSRAFFGIAYGFSQVDSTAGSLFMQGSQFTFGMDLAPHVSTEAIYRSFPAQQRSELQELEGRLLYKPRMSDQWKARLGAGLVSRNLSMPLGSSNQMLIRWSLGIERKLTDWLRVFPEVSLRNNLATNEMDRPGMDAGVGFQVVF